MRGAMMHFPLTPTHVLERAGTLYGESQIVSRLPDRSLHRHRYQDFYRRTRALAGALQGLGLQKGDRVATLMCNHSAHLEAYLAIRCAGAVLRPYDIACVANRARDRFLIVDDVLLPLLEKFNAQVKIERILVKSGGE